MALEKNRH